MPITSVSARTVDRISHCAENDLQPDKLCSRCAAIDFSALFSKQLREIEFGSPSTWKPRECEVCDFFSGFLSRCSNPRYTHPLAPDMPLRLLPYGDYESALGVVRQALPEAVWSATNAFCMFVDEQDSFTDNGVIFRSSEPMIDMTLPKIDWHPVKKWIQTDAEEQRVVQGKASLGNTSLYPGLLSGNNISLDVIDCQSRERVQILPGTEYVTLSYVWGPDGAALESDCAAGTSSIMLPLTVEDSLLVCLKLGYRYLWVDRYCIPQTDSPERHRQIPRTDEIYANSTLTIVACAGKDPNHGLPGVTRPRAGLPGIKFLLDEASWYLQALPMAADIGKSIWASRGWTYQEALLSQRKLYFTDSQLYFEGVQSVQCEWAARSTNKPTEDVPWILSQVDYLGNPNRIYDCIESFIRRNISFESDALNAMLGIFAVFERRHQVQHIWGMPYMSAHESSGVGRETRQPSLWLSLGFQGFHHTTRRKAYPSWSWLGWRTPSVYYNDWLPNAAAFILNIFPELVSGSVISLSDYENNPDGQTRHADPLSHFIHVQAYMSPIVSTIGNSLDLADGTKIPYADWELVECCAEKLLLIHMPLRWSHFARHLLVQDLGDHWERVDLLSTICLENSECEKKSEEERAKDCDNCRYHYRRDPAGTLRTIRLG